MNHSYNDEVNTIPLFYGIVPQMIYSFPFQEQQCDTDVGAPIDIADDVPLFRHPAEADEIYSKYEVRNITC